MVLERNDALLDITLKPPSHRNKRCFTFSSRGHIGKSSDGSLHAFFNCEREMWHFRHIWPLNLQSSIIEQ
jgi:hypothetical protein